MDIAPAPMTIEQKRLVRIMFEQVWPITETTAALFYGRLFELNADLQPLFTGDMQEQGQKLMDMFSMAVRYFDQPDRLTALFRDLGRRHMSYGVQTEDYVTVGEALTWTLEITLGDAWTSETSDAWGAAYTMLAETMLTATSPSRL